MTAVAPWRIGAPAMLAPAMLALAVLALAGCKDEAKKPAPSSAGTSTATLIAATQTDIRAGAFAAAQFRGVQVYQQARADRVAVCGQVTPFADSPGTFVPFVSVITLPPKDDRMGHASFDHRIGTTTSDASRVYLAIVAFCWEGGGPATGPAQSVTSLPPLPDAVPDPRSAPPITVSTPARPAEGTPASGSATMRQAANVHSDPHGPSIRVLPKGTALHVFSQAAGGWYQVGDAAPFGWVHESMLELH